MTLSPQYQRVSRREAGSRAAAHVNPRVGMLLEVEELRQDARRFPPPAWVVYVLYTPSLTHSAILNPQLTSLPSVCDVRRHLEKSENLVTVNNVRDCPDCSPFRRSASLRG